MGSCVSKGGGSGQELDPFASRDESSQASDLSSDYASHWSGLLSEPFCFSNLSRNKVDASLLSYVINEAKTKHLPRSKAERRSTSLRNSTSHSSQWHLDSPPLREIGDIMADETQRSQARVIELHPHSLERIPMDNQMASHVDPSHIPRARYLPHPGLDVESGELSIFAAESYFRESEPFPRAAAGGITDPNMVADLGESASIYHSDSDRERDHSSMLSECCTFSLAESVHERSSNRLNNLLAGKVDVHLPFGLHLREEVNNLNEVNDQHLYRETCSKAVKPNANILSMDAAMCNSVLNKCQRTDGELSVRISSKAPLSSLYRQMREPGGGVFWSYGDDRSSVSSMELQTASSADNLYSTRSETPRADSQGEKVPLFSTDSLPFHRPDSKDRLDCQGNDVSFRHIFAPSLSSIPYLEDAHVFHRSKDDATARIRRISPQ